MARKAVTRPVAPPKLETGLNPSDVSAFVWSDLRGVERTKERGEAKGVRNWSKITGITLHQTAVDFGEDPMRMLNVPVHGATLQNGRIVLLHEPTDYMWHAGALNRTDIGIEVSCRACGIEGNGETLWLPKKYDDLRGDDRLELAIEATEGQIMATRRLVRYYIELVEQHGGKIKYIHAHRQSSKSRVSDPGSRIWLGVGEWAVEEYGLSVGPTPKWTKGGYALPDVWTGYNRGVRYSWKISGF